MPCFLVKKVLCVDKKSSFKTESWDAPEGFWQRQDRAGFIYLDMQTIFISGTVWYKNSSSSLSARASSTNNCLLPILFSKENSGGCYNNFYLLCWFISPCGPSCPFCFSFLSFCTSFHTTSSHVQHVGISRLWLLCQQPDFHISCRCLWEHLSDDESTLSNLPLKSEAINVGSTYSFLSNIFLFLDSINNLRIIFYDSGAAIQ